MTTGITSLFGSIDPLTQLALELNFAQSQPTAFAALSQNNNASVVLAQSLLSLFLSPNQSSALSQASAASGSVLTDTQNHPVSVGTAVDGSGNVVSTAQFKTSSGQTVGFQTAPPGGLPGLTTTPPSGTTLPTTPTIVDANGSVVPVTTYYDNAGGAVIAVSLKNQFGALTTFYSQVDSTGRALSAVAGPTGATSTQLFVDSTGAAIQVTNNTDLLGNPVNTIAVKTTTGALVYFETQATDAAALLTGSNPVLTTTAPAGAVTLPAVYNANSVQLPVTQLYVTNGANVGATVQEITLYNGGTAVNFFSVTNSSGGTVQPIKLQPVPGATVAPQNLAPFSQNPALSNLTAQNQSLSVLSSELLVLTLQSILNSSHNSSLFGPTII